MSEDAVRSAFGAQADYCRRLGSPFTGLLCELLASQLDVTTAFGRAVLAWPGDPAPLADGVPLRAAGALHALARSGAAPGLAAVYPPTAGDAAALGAAVRRALRDHEQALLPFLDSTPQTNEVGRSAVLYPGLLDIASRTRTLLDLYEIGSSAGLNLNLDRYGYRFGAATGGVADSRVQLEPAWEGPLPEPGAGLRVRNRRGCDLQPFDARRAEDRSRLIAYVWADQVDRLARLDAALAIAHAHPPVVDKADAGEWVEQTFPLEPVTGVTRVLMHSVTWMYLPPATQARITAHLQRAGAMATADAPVAWLRFEHVQMPGLVLTSWPGGEQRVLAEAQPHGAWVRWRGANPAP